MASIAVIYPAQITAAINAVGSWNNGAIIKMAFIFVLTLNFTKIAQLGVKAWKNLPEARKEEMAGTLEGIPTVELLDHLFQFKSFKRSEVEEKFGLPRNRYTTLAMKLENLGVLIRGENNARVLNEEYSRADIAAIMASSWSVKGLKKVFRQVGPTSFTSEPTAKGIAGKVQEMLETPPSPSRFQLHKLEN